MAYENFKLEGTEDLLNKLDNAVSVMPDVVMDRLELHAEKILSMADLEIPWDTTHLLQTGSVEPYNEGDLVGFQIGFNAMSSSNISEGSDYNYGLRQHEDLTLHHPKPGRKAKFLEDPFNRHKGEVIPKIVSYIDGLYQAGVPDMVGMMRSKRASLSNLGGRFI